MAAIDPKKLKIAEMLNMEFPKELEIRLAKEIVEVSEQESYDLNYLSRRTAGQVYEAIAHYYKCSEQEAERMVGQTIEEGNRNLKRAVNMARDEYTNASGYISRSTVRKPISGHLDRTFNEGIDERESFDGMKKDIYNQSQDNIYLKEVKNGIDRTVIRKIEDIVFTEVFASLKRKLNVYESKKGEETFYELKSILGNKFVPQIIELYNSGSDRISKITEKVITSGVEELEQKYLRTLEKEEKTDKDSQEKTEKNDFEKELQGNTVALEDSFENYMSSEEELKSYENKKGTREDLLERFK
ncbi:MAG: hypothetical protein PHR25_01395 [Clostridia bacterium]|nr:hypothetical protein [Clostridia bacterium]MDD4375422.1 hypothetical protein [Clostridia bacterium]